MRAVGRNSGAYCTASLKDGPWRICFEFRKGDAYDVEIVDYHKG
jgi:proteic killer suppression protein